MFWVEKSNLIMLTVMAKRDAGYYGYLNKNQHNRVFKKRKYFSVMADETPDIANHGQMTILIRYVTDELKI